MEISRETFINLPTDNKLDVVFDLLKEAVTKQEEIEKKVESCNIQIGRRKKFDSGVAGMMGFIGGLVGFIMQKALFK